MVNMEQISRQDLARECLRRYGKDVLESMVNKHLIQQACIKNNIMITEEDVTNEITGIATKFNLTTDRWMQLLAQERNVKPTEYRRDIIWPTARAAASAWPPIRSKSKSRRNVRKRRWNPNTVRR